MTLPPSEGSLPLALVVEEDAETCRAVRGALASEFEVAAVGTSADQVAQGAVLRPDLVVTSTGPALLARMDPALRDVPFLLLTDAAEVEARAALLRRAAQDFVIRPLSAAEIRMRARNLVDVKRARDLLRRAVGDDARDLPSLARACLLRQADLAQDLADLRQRHEHEGRLSRTKTAYLRTVGHEMAAPLASLREALARLRESTASLPAAAGHAAGLRAIEVSTEWLAELGQAMREYARGDQGGG